MAAIVGNSFQNELVQAVLEVSSSQMKRLTAGAVGIAIMLIATSARAESPDQRSWDPKAAAAYLDSRAAWWMEWPNAQRDHGTFCVSCHTAVPFALARPALRAALAERSATANETRIWRNVTQRVTSWRDVEPFYPDQTRGIPKSSESRGTEAVLNALILASRDAESGRLSDEARTAFGNMWALQMRTKELSGSWAWLNFGLDPWESTTAPYFGASLAALAVGTAPGGYSATPEIQESIKLLRDYLRREEERQPLFNRLVVLWAAARWPELLAPERARAIGDAALAKQREDGGWNFASLGEWKRLDGSELDRQSDGYATALATLALGQSGRLSMPEVQRGLDWLKRNQDPATGRWIASSVNKQREPLSDIGRFMNDAATAFAVLSLSQARGAH
jgi:squalene-hopene/tetraprenyl-beta-curcumene cyclase